ncbi:MAG: hypothetical protein J7J15_02950 [Candidatus Aenigmarchaeota archaeon]|nr:hypothetical protein [Candidatus Aenigmarchaeota archaeon]
MVKIFRYFKKSFEVYKRNFVPIILSVLLIGIICGLFLVLSIFALFGPKNINTMTESYMMLGEFTDFEQEFSEFLNLQNVGLFLLFMILGGITAIFLQSGFWGICFHGIKKRVTMKTFFTTIRKRGISYFSAILLVLIIFFVISLLLSLPATIFPLFIPITLIILILITPFFILISPAVISGRSVIESLEQSFKLGKKYYFDLILLIILIYLFSLVNFIPIIGSLLSYFLISPLFALVICSFYIDVKQKPETQIKTKSVQKKGTKKLVKKSKQKRADKSNRKKLKGKRK